MNKKILIGCIIAIALIVLSSFTSVVAIDTKQSIGRGETLYVGGSGPGNYTKIQHAIDNASNGDTVYVYNGEYNDYYPDGQFGYTVNINKEIILLGEDKNHTIINGTGQAITVRVSADNVEINGFTIQNGGGAFCGGIRIMDGKYRTRIRYNIIKNNNAGIFMMFNRDVDIRNNIIKNNGNGIYVFDSTTTDIIENLIANNTNGIVIVYGNTDALFFPINFIVRNEIRDNNKGIQAENTQFLAQCNNFINNEKHTEIYKGVLLSYLKLYFKTRNIFSRNYWDDWVIKIPKPVKGLGVIWIQTPKIDIPILQLTYFEIDLRPCLSPYNYVDIVV